MEEIWKDVPGYEGMYQVSNLGNVKSLIYNKERFLSKVIDKRYYQVGMYKNKKKTTRKIHQLVAEAFLNHTPCGLKLVVDHINNNTLDNRLENLQIITHRENVYKIQDKGSSKYKGVCWCNTFNKWKTNISIKNKSIHLGYFTNELDAHKAYQNKLKEYE